MRKMKYVVIMQDNSVGYGEYVHLIGIFDTRVLAEIAITKCKECIEEHHRTLVNFMIVEIEVNKINCPYYDEIWGLYRSDCNIGGYSE